MIRETLRRRQMWKAHEAGVVHLPYPPLEVWIEPTNHCNLKCVKCPHAVGLKRSQGLMDGSVFRNLVDEIQDYAFTVSLHLGGESLIHKQLPEFIEYAAGRGLRTVLHTNATLLNEARSRALIGAGLSVISFSVDGDDEETYAAVDKGGDFHRAVEGVRTFLGVRRQMGSRDPFTVVQCLSPDPGRTGDEGLPFLLALGADYLKVAGFHAWSGSFSHDRESPVPARGFEALREAESEYSPCNNLWYGISVFWNGDVVPCCMDMEGEYPVGSISDTPLRELWNNERMVSLRTALVEKRFREQDLCRDCGYLWGKRPGNAWRDLKGQAKQWIRHRPGLAKPLGIAPWGVHDWNS